MTGTSSRKVFARCSAIPKSNSLGVTDFGTHHLQCLVGSAGDPTKFTPTVWLLGHGGREQCHLR